MSEHAFDNSFVLTSPDGKTLFRISRHGGAIVEGFWNQVPVLRPYSGAHDAPFQVLKAGSFPLVPFGNRLEGNRFSFEGSAYELATNLDWDAHYLHGDGWLDMWDVEQQDDQSAVLTFVHPKRDGSPYVYAARQEFRVVDHQLSVVLHVTNQGPKALPFGIGHHPFFPMTPATTLQFNATSYWTEKAGWLPDQNMPIPLELDFSQPNHLPKAYVNSGFEGFDGVARIALPDTGIVVTMTADKQFGRSFLFVSDDEFEPGCQHDYFCFEPMSHSAGGHLQEDLGGLTVLAPGQTLVGSVAFSVEALGQCPSPIHKTAVGSIKY
jgi:aldose 1-epimerase